jgi:FkbM family methyltransferase
MRMFISKSQFLTTAKGFFRSFGLEVSLAKSAATERNVLQTLFRNREFTFVLDVGANTGQYGRLVRSCGYGGPIVSFEPLAAAYEKLASRAALDPQWIVAERMALGAGASHTIINVAGNSVSSSLLTMNARHIEAAPHSANVGTEQIRVIALDDCVEQYVKANGGGLLKIDTQGFEMEVLRGAHQSLSNKIAVVQAELSFVELYDGQPLMLEVCNFLKQYNFSLHHIIPGLRDPKSGRLLQIDGIFSKDS